MNIKNINIDILNKKQAIDLGKAIACFCYAPCIIYLSGKIGIGKTTFCNGFLQAIGYTGNVKSPTYNIFEKYIFSHILIYHIDLYRIQYAEELEFIGIRDFFCQKSIYLIEWPKFEKILPQADISLLFEYKDNSLIRTVNLLGMTLKGQKILSSFNKKIRY
ncbi:tRNA (adenosine(37)-N6)-threonylcarbamoyltransferase complex ATPase subunit type 1 TsaE [Candidatus Schneideria nysicola]|uniref:tRNA (adenosine(37)-N6)-threonylcarbamoyltransferase complex ATPase subunit type 1 TsaE n=1 Tax=Candidatus Schneideria nysicola TaxID=1081631 RepID=UPI001CAA436F|nr:tRNA (adenosine(37)-N6)-threonylcarbamoyltransferase complex ATPase subunit type 1 TsaE [Candidatus Schneideria nysicola]UAJ65570.1 tRNA (adenosine(37)-N6)-threonylcarbamoyltransferase complex ATPase subunit type 1 TsaE [Candidatus Schneideria nysicola]